MARQSLQPSRGYRWARTAEGPQARLGGPGGWAGGAHHLQFVLLQDLIQILPLLVVEVEVFTL